MSKYGAPVFKPSYFNHLITWVEDLPGSSWGYYTGLGVFLLALQTAVSWIEGAIPVGTFQPEHIFLSAAIPFIIASIPFFDNRARSALDSIKPALTIDDEKIQEFAYQLTHLPAIKSILASILALLLTFSSEFIGGSPYQNTALGGYPFSLNLSRMVYLICWWFFGVFIYHTIHQLGLINQIYTRHTLIDLFRMHPLYGFSNLAALTAGGLIMLPYGFMLVTPSVQISDPVVLMMYLIFSVIALATFLLPQLGLYRLQTAEKKCLMDEINQRYMTTMVEVHRRVDQSEFDEVAKLNDTLNTLSKEKDMINKISTWPWQPETFRWLFTALVLPLLMWIAQNFLGQWLSP
jgi:hypothetical protein